MFKLCNWMVKPQQPGWYSYHTEEQQCQKVAQAYTEYERQINLWCIKALTLGVIGYYLQTSISLTNCLCKLEEIGGGRWPALTILSILPLCLRSSCLPPSLHPPFQCTFYYTQPLSLHSLSYTQYTNFHVSKQIVLKFSILKYFFETLCTSIK